MDIKLHYIEKGTGFPLILLHGNGEDLTYFEHQIEYFSKSRRVIAIDTRGHGQSPRGSKPFTILQFAEDLLHFMDDLEIEMADLLGFSDGGNIALTFALQHQNRTRSLILNGANLSPRGVKFSVQAPIVLGYYTAKLLGGKDKAELLGLMVKEPHISPNELHSILVPTLVIAGNHDMIKEEHTKIIASSLPNATLSILTGSHFIANKNPAAFNKAVEDFLINHEF